MAKKSSTKTYPAKGAVVSPQSSIKMTPGQLATVRKAAKQQVRPR